MTESTKIELRMKRPKKTVYRFSTENGSCSLSYKPCSVFNNISRTLISTRKGHLEPSTKEQLPSRQHT